MIMTLVGYRV
jgi:hypothetical protein